MHFDALYLMKGFVKKYLNSKQKLRILEVGSYCDSKPEKDRIFRRYFRDNSNWEFIGMDLIPGPNVDIVSKEPYNYPFENDSFDVVISGNTMEHVEDIYRWIKELTRITNNLICITVPNEMPEHKFPRDCWRIYPDGMRFLLENIAGLEILECRRSKNGKGTDTIGIAQKYAKEKSKI